jgi:hypothetical protein
VKKEYIKPSMKVVELKRRAKLLAGSAKADVNVVYNGEEDI